MQRVPIPYADMLPVPIHYTVAFLEVYLAGHNQYHGDLAPGQTATVGPAQVSIVGE
jgi:hypothetical protein